MLVLSRKRSESIQIGDDIVVTVLESDRGRVRLGIDAPKEIPVRRTELRKAISTPSSCPDPLTVVVTK
jgi:carbon storage regulator